MLEERMAYEAEDFLNGDRIPEDAAWTDHSQGDRVLQDAVWTDHLQGGSTIW